MNISKAEKILVLQMLKDREPIPNNETYNLILFDLICNGLVISGEKTSITYYGLTELESWDAVLGASFDHHLLQKPYGYA